MALSSRIASLYALYQSETRMRRDGHHVMLTVCWYNATNQRKDEKSGVDRSGFIIVLSDALVLPAVAIPLAVAF
jgi:hypothetical protein